MIDCRTQTVCAVRILPATALMSTTIVENCRRGGHNLLLNESFRQHVRVLANTVDVDWMEETLTANGLVTVEELSSLGNVSNRVERCSRMIQTLLDDTGRPEKDHLQVLEELRLILRREPAYSWLADEVDHRHQELISAHEKADRAKAIETSECYRDDKSSRRRFLTLRSHQLILLNLIHLIQFKLI